MKNYNLLFLIFILPLGLTAQTHSAESPELHFNGGLIGGGTASQIQGDGIGGLNKVGVNLGVVIDIRRNKKRSLQLGIVYNQKGSKKPPNPRAGDYETWSYRFTYIDLPITLNYKYKTIDIMVGLQPSILLAAEENFYGVGYEPTGLPIKSYDLGAVLGIRTIYSEHVQLFIRTSQSILAIAPRPENPIGTARWDNRMMNMTLEIGFIFMVGRI